MKTKLKPKARKMWANYYPTGIVCHPLRRMARINAPANCLSATIPVAVIPLDDMPALQSTAYNAYCEAQDANLDSMECVVAALAAIGVLPKQRKGRK